MLVSKAAALNSQRDINVKRGLHEIRASPQRNSLWSMTLGPYSSHLAHELTYLHAGLPAGNKGPSQHSQCAWTPLRKKGTKISCEWGGQRKSLGVGRRKCFLLKIREDRKVAKKSRG